MDYIYAIWEILKSWYSLASLVLFFFELAIGLKTPLVIPPVAYISTLFVGFFASSVRIIAGKNSSLNEFKKDRPALLLSLVRVGGGQLRFILENIWSKPVKDVYVKPLRSKEKLFSFKFELPGTNILRPGRKKTLIVVNNVHNELLAAFTKEYANRNYKMTILFSDLNGRSYKNVFSLGKDGIKLLSLG